MSVHAGPNNSENGLVFYYDMGNTQKSWKGRPSRNYVAYTPNYVNWNSQDAVVSQISTEIQRISSVSNVAIDVIWWGGFNTGTADSATKISYSAYVRGQGTSYLQIHQVNTSPNTVAHMSISGNTITLDSSQWKRIEIKDIYQASGTASQNILVGLGAGVGNYVEVKNVQCEYQTFPSAYINPSLYTNGIRSNTQAITDLTGNNIITANSLTYSSDGSFSFDGTSGFLSTPLIPNSSQGAFECWIKMDLLKDYNTIFDNALGVNDWEFWVYATGVARFRTTADNLDVIVDSATLSSGVWYNLTVCWNASGAQCYTNGVLSSSDSVVGTRSSPSTLSIGGGNAGNTKFDGVIPVVKIYNRALSAAEVRINFNSLRGRFGI